jgi:hypothetical protein
VGEVGILVGVFEGRRCQQTAVTLNDGPFLIQHFNSLSHSELPETFTTRRYSPGIPFFVIVIDFVSTRKSGSWDLEYIEHKDK